MDRIAVFVPRYADILAEYICSEEHTLRSEMALSEATEIGKEVLAVSPNTEHLFELHRRGQRLLAERWSATVTSPEHVAARERLIEGDAIPLILALKVPHNLAQRMHQEDRWGREHAKLVAVFEQIDSMMLIYDNEGRLDEVNPAFVKATGWSVLEAAGDATGVWNTPLPMDGTQRCRGEQRRRDGTTYIAEWSVSPIFGSDGRLVNHVCVARDVTKQQQIEDSLRENDKLRAVATLAGGIAHDFNNLLGSIMGLAELCELETTEGSRQARNLVRIRQAGDKAAVLVRQMLDFSRQTPKAVQSMLASALLAHSDGLLRAAVPRRLGLVVSVEEDGPVCIDLVQMEQVLLNVTRNAAHAMRKRDGSIRIVVDRADPLAAAHEGTVPRHVRIRVIDSGEGIAPDILGKIFDPFFTTKPVGEGTGLGLSAVHGIVNSHDGVIEVASEQSAGSTFSIFLPLVGTAGSSDAHAGATGHAAPARAESLAS